MKKLRNVLCMLLVFVICISCLPAVSHAKEASIALQPDSGLRLVEMEDKEIIIGLSEGKTLDQLMPMLGDFDWIRAVKGDNLLEGHDVVATGTMLTCGDRQLHVVVKGDTTGDGCVDASDLLRVKAYFTRDFHLEDLEFAAADCSEDGEVNTTDYLQMKRYFMDGWDIYSNSSVAAAAQGTSTSSLSVVSDNQSLYMIGYDSELERSAAYTLRDVLLEETGVELPVVSLADGAEWGIMIRCKSVTEAAMGNYGYAIQTDGEKITVSAATLSGFDKGIVRLMNDCSYRKTVKVPRRYAAVERLEWEADYVLQGDDYKPQYQADMFYNDKNDSVAYVSNAMWHMFGTIDDGQNLVYRFGNEPTWFEWMSEKIAWSTDAQYISELKQKIRTFPQTSTGYMWSWSTHPHWRVDESCSMHYDGTFRYISAVYDIISWEGNTKFLYEKDPDSVTGNYGHMDSSGNRTVLEKTEACMDYILERLYGKEGYIRLTEQSVYLTPDGSIRFDYVHDAGTYCWNNTGRNGSSASNYWDNLCFGNYDGYSNALFYNALHSMAGIYRMLGGKYLEEAKALEELAVKVKEKFNEMYWSDATGRYIACIDADGRSVDYGLTFHNFEIMKYGLADSEKAKSILDWVDGDRIIAGESRTGGDIFSYAKVMEAVDLSVFSEIAQRGLRLAAVTNTIAINNSANPRQQGAWWHAPSGIDVWSGAAYGRHLENGGYIFYPVFYELMARTEYEGAQSTTDRLREILKVYEYNRLVSDAAAVNSATWLEGLNGEFPENGLVPTTYLYSLVGLSAEHDGLHLAPAFNDVYEYMGVKKVSYGGRTYAIQVNRDASCKITPAGGNVNLKLHYSPERFQTSNYKIALEYKNGTTTYQTVTPDENGVIHAQITGKDVSRVQIIPVLK